MLAERWRVHYNTVRPHSALGYKPPAPEAWLTTTKKGHGDVETASRFPRLHTPTAVTQGHHENESNRTLASVPRESRAT